MRSRYVYCPVFGLVLWTLALVAEPPAPAQSESLSYSNFVATLLVSEAKYLAKSLKLPETWEEVPRDTNVRVDGKYSGPRGRVTTGRFDYEFFSGTLRHLRRTDLFQDKGPDSPILRHLTNEVLALTPKAAGQRAVDLLAQLSFDTKALREVYHLRVSDDLMTAHPIRNGGPSFPKELRFFGELISRKKIKITVKFVRKSGQRSPGSIDFGDVRVEFLATTGELLSLWLSGIEELERSGVYKPRVISVVRAADFSPPRYFQVTRSIEVREESPDSTQVAEVFEGAWRELTQQLGTNQPKGFLACDNLNVPDLIQREIRRRSPGVPLAGVSHRWRLDLPLEPSQSAEVARERRGFSLAAICGGVEVQFVPVQGTGDSSLTRPNASDWNQMRMDVGRQLAPQLETLCDRLELRGTNVEHAVFSFSAGEGMVPMIFNDVLASRLRERSTPVLAVESLGRLWRGGGGVYSDGSLLSNAIVVLRLSGHLPLEFDSSSVLLRRPPTRRLANEVSGPISLVLSAFGPNPLEEVVEQFGGRIIRILKEADRVDSYRIRSNNPDDLSRPGRPNIAGHEIIRSGKTQPKGFATKLGAALLNERNGFGVAKMCIWSPGVVFKAWRGKESVTVMICFECDDLTVKAHDADGQVIGSTGFDFSANRPSLVALAKQAFPADSRIQSLKPID